MSVDRKIEQAYPYVLALVSAPGWICLFHWLNLSTQEAKDLFLAILNVSAIAAGFLGTAASVLLAMDSVAVMKDLKQSGALVLLNRYIISAIRHQFWLVLFSVSLLLLYPKIYSPHILMALAVAWGISAVLAASSSFRIIHLFGKIITAD
jgi:hypothetical protein